MNKYAKVIKRPISILLMAVLVLALLSGCNSKEKTNGQYVKNVKVSASDKASISLTVEYAGNVKPLEEVTIASRLPGRVSSIKADVGTEVKEGQLLFVLDTKALNAQLLQSKAAVDNAKANLVRVNDSAQNQQLIQYEAAADQAQVQYDDVKRTYEKLQSLYNANAASKQQLDDAESAFKLAGVQLDTAINNLKLFKEKAAPQSTAIAAAQLEQAQAAYEAASIQVDDAAVTAPITGTISARNIDEGEMVSGGYPAFTIINTKIIMIEISVPDTIVSKLTVGQQVPVTITALSDRTLTGLIDNISPAADARTQGYTIKLKLDNQDNAIKPGMLAKVVLPMESKENVIVVPNEAIFVEDGLQYIFVVENDKAKRKTVTVGLSNDHITEITSGLSQGETIITEGQSFLNDGEKVNVSK